MSCVILNFQECPRAGEFLGFYALQHIFYGKFEIFDRQSCGTFITYQNTAVLNEFFQITHTFQVDTAYIVGRYSTFPVAVDDGRSSLVGQNNYIEPVFQTTGPDFSIPEQMIGKFISIEQHIDPAGIHAGLPRSKQCDPIGTQFFGFDLNSASLYV